MSLEENKAVVRRLYEAFNKHNPDLLDDLMAPDFIDASNTAFELARARGLYRLADFRKNVPFVSKIHLTNALK